jgi:hypothetical protein
VSTAAVPLAKFVPRRHDLWAAGGCELVVANWQLLADSLAFSTQAVLSVAGLGLLDKDMYCAAPAVGGSYWNSIYYCRMEY